MRLLRKKYRDQTGMFLLEGPRPVMDAVKTGNTLQTVFIRSTGADSPDAAALSALCEERGITCAVLPEELFGRLSDTENSQGVIAVARKSATKEPGGRAVILDRLQDPGNIGTIIRTAEAAGFSSLIAIKGTGDIYAPKTVRAAAGSLLRVDVFEVEDADEAISLCAKYGMKIVASDLEGAEEYTDADLTDALAIVVGNEGSGISEEIRQAADIRVRIPMEGNIESLNAAVAAGILMYESVRQKRAAGKVK